MFIAMSQLRMEWCPRNDEAIKINAKPIDDTDEQQKA
jgi:hypothetical protein